MGIFTETILPVLQHTCTIVPPVLGGKDGQEQVPDEWGATSVTQGNPDEEQVSCLIDARTRRHRGSDQKIHVTTVRITFPPTTEIGIDYTLKNGLNKHLEKLFEEGKVISIDRIQDVDEGTVAITVDVEEQ